MSIQKSFVGSFSRIKIRTCAYNIRATLLCLDYFHQEQSGRLDALLRHSCSAIPHLWRVINGAPAEILRLSEPKV